MSNRDKPAPSVPPAEWEKHRETIRTLYIAQNRKLRDVVDSMAKDHGFKATEAQYNKQLRSWGMKKNKRNYTRADPYGDDDGPGDKRQCVSTGPRSMEDSDSTPERRVALSNSTQAVSTATTGNYSARSLVTNPQSHRGLGQQVSPGTGGMFGQSGSSMMPGIQSAMPMIGNQTFSNDFGPYYQTPMATWPFMNQPQDLQGDAYQQWSYNLLFEPFDYQPMSIIAGANEQVPQAVPSIPTRQISHNPVPRARQQPIHVAAHAGNFLAVEFLLENAPDCADDVNERNISPLLMAAQGGHLKVIELLLRYEVDVQRAGIEGRTPIHQAAQEGHLEVVRQLLEHGAGADPRDKNGVSPLWSAAQDGHKEIVELLIKKGAAIELTNKRCNRQPIHQAAQQGHLEVVRQLLEHGAGADPRDKDGISPLWSAAQQGHKEIIELLIKKGVVTELASNDGNRRPIHQAAQSGHTEVVRLLLEAGAKASPEQDSFDKDTPSPFFLAAHNGHVSVGKLLIERGANPEFGIGSSKCQPIHLVAHRGHVDFVRLLIEHQVNLDARQENGWTPLMIAAQKGYVEIVELLLKHGANIDATEKDNATALFIASQGGHMEIVKKLHENKAKVFATKSSRRRPIHQAAQNAHLDVVKFLVLEFEEDVNAEDADQITPLMLASQGKEETRLEMMKFLYRKGAKAQII